MPTISSWRDVPRRERRHIATVFAGAAVVVLGVAMSTLVGGAAAQPADTAASPLGSAKGDPADGCDMRFEAPRRTVTAVPDAEHLVLDDGDTVQLIGALPPLPPLSADPTKQWSPAIAAHEALRSLALGKRVALAASSVMRDRYGMRLAHAFVESGGGGGLSWVQGALLRTGHARAYAIPGNADCIDALIAAEAMARSEKRGIWADPVYAPRSAHRPGELAKSALAYELVEGRVRRASRGRNNLFIGFGGRRGSAFTVIVPGALANDNPAWSASLLDTAGKRIRVRGWIVERDGPAIEITHPGEIELLDSASAPR